MQVREGGRTERWESAQSKKNTEAWETDCTHPTPARDVFTNSGALLKPWRSEYRQQLMLSRFQVHAWRV